MAIGSYILIGLAFLIFLYMMFELRHKVLVQKLENKVGESANDWKWGIFYFNPNDQRMFVPKRIESLGWTLNFARPSSQLFLLTFVLCVILLIII
jgi:uncharacterized membrane protein